MQRQLQLRADSRVSFLLLALAGVSCVNLSPEDILYTMCGIFCELLTRSTNGSANFVDFKSVDPLGHLERRGPDCQSFSELNLKHDRRIRFCSSVLWLQGNSAAHQPYEVHSEDKHHCGTDFLLWNGDWYSMDRKTEFGEINTHVSDTSVVANFLVASELPEAFSRIRGPYAFVFYSSKARSIWFGRDTFGRRSLLTHTSENRLILCSTAVDSFEMSEVPATGIYRVDVETFEFFHYPWDPKFLPSAPSADVPSLLRNATVSCVIKPPVIIVALKHLTYEHNLIGMLKQHLHEAVKKRIYPIPPICNLCMNLPDCHHTKVAIMFSGGLDSTVLAALAHSVLVEMNDTDSKIDLLNVSFVKSKTQVVEVTPDRKTAEVALQELTAIPGAKERWNLVEINVDVEELVSCRKQRIRSLILPRVSVLDDSIGCALWFGCRGQGVLAQSGEDYVCRSRIVLTGMGADEQLGGYSRHRRAFERAGMDAVALEVEMELSRIWERNCGRDDRVLSDHGRSPRHPFLDESVVEFLASVPLELRMNLSEPPGVGDKVLLRKLAYSLGLSQTASTPKRAIQFGSRIAKIENRKDKGHNVSSRLIS